MRIGVLGLGSIASRVAEDLAARGHELLVTERSRVRSAALARAFDTVRVGSPQSVASECGLLFLGVTGKAAESALAPLDFPAGLPVVSFMADIEDDDLRGLIAPAKLEATMIPFPWIARTRSPILVFPGTPVLESLFGGRHDVIALPDRDTLGEYLTAQAAVSPALKLAETAATWLGAGTGDADGAERFLRLLIGSALMARSESGELGLADMLKDLNTPGGYNQRLRTHMEDAGAFDALVAGMDILRTGGAGDLGSSG